MQAIAQQVEDALTPLLAAQGYELVLVEHVPAQRVLRLFIDRVPGCAPGAVAAAPALASPAPAPVAARCNVTLDDCTHVSRLAGDVLDAEGIGGVGELGGRYTLEVSSPGLDRPLTRPAHFRRCVGQQVRVATRPSHAPAGQRQFVGLLADADATSIRLAADGVEHTLPYAAIDRARLVPDL